MSSSNGKMSFMGHEFDPFCLFKAKPPRVPTKEEALVKLLQYVDIDQGMALMKEVPGNLCVPTPIATVRRRKTVMETYDAEKMNVTMICQAADLFSKNYGVWGVDAATSMQRPELTQGRRIKMKWSFLVKKILPDPETMPDGSLIKNYYIRCMSKDEPIGNLFAIIWRYRNMKICWITQLVVREDSRNLGIAKQMMKALRIQHLKSNRECVVGILSVHPAAIRACYRVFGARSCHLGSSRVNLSGKDEDFLRERARAIMGSCPVDYVRSASSYLKGNCFVAKEEAKEEDEDMCCADTQFYIDHGEQRRVLNSLEEWPFSRELPEGYEFLALFRVGSSFDPE